MIEPVAWMVVNNDGRDAFVTADPMLANVNIGQRALPLYAAPVMDTCADVRSSSPTSGSGFVEREIALARRMTACRGDDERLDKTTTELADLKQACREGWRYAAELEEERKRLQAENAELLAALKAVLSVYGRDDVRAWMLVRDIAQEAVNRATQTPES